MKIYIPTSGRFTLKEQKTLTSMLDASPANRRNVRMVVQHKQAGQYLPVAKHFGVKLAVLPPSITTISPTRQWILDNETKPFAMADDDLLFFERRTDDDTKFLKIDGDRVFDMFDELAYRMSTEAIVHGGVLAREGGNRITGVQNVYAQRMMRVLAYDPKAVRRLGARFDRLKFKQDFDMTLQLLRAGEQNLLLADYVQGQYNEGCSNAPGGCSVYRSEDDNREASEGLARLHPGFVKVVEKHSKTSWGGKPRIDVSIQWKKAYASAN
jgi:hypothetical protein